MSISSGNSNISVHLIGRGRAARVVGKYHYSGYLSANATRFFGLFQDQKLIGCCCFGLGATPKTAKTINKFGWNFLELMRLALSVNARNYASFLISQSLKYLPPPILIVSYADTNWGHIGKIYQATNWIYAGKTEETEFYRVNGVPVHTRSLTSVIGTTNPEIVKRVYGDFDTQTIKGKHRYFYPIGSKGQRKAMRRWIEQRFGIFEYPRGETVKYDVNQTRKKGPLL